MPFSNSYIEKIIGEKISNLNFTEPDKPNSKKYKTRNSYAIVGQNIVVKLNNKHYSIISKKDKDYLEDYKFYYMSQGPVLPDALVKKFTIILVFGYCYFIAVL